MPVRGVINHLTDVLQRMPISSAVPFSRTTSRLVSGLAEVSASEYPSGLRQPRHGHDAAYFTLVMQGAYGERVGRTSTDARSGRFIFHPAGEEHAVDFRAPCTRVVRLLPLPAMLSDARLLGLDLSLPVPRLASAQLLMRRVVREATSESVDAPLVVDALASELLVVLANDGEGTTRASLACAAHARAMIDAEPTRAHTLAELASAAGCHPMTLSRAFRRAHGCSVGTYARRTRLRHACALLAARAMPISMVAATCGFADQAHLTRSLRRATGRTPGEILAVAG